MENKSNKFGIKVGDFFKATWGYDQTNVDWFQVIALAGKSSVRVREVNPPIIECKASGYDAEDRVYSLDTSVILPPAERSSWIKDQEKGDLKRIRDVYYAPSFHLASFADATLCSEKTNKAYVSWYA